MSFNVRFVCNVQLRLYIYYVSPTQINFIVPDVRTGAQQVTVKNAAGTSQTVSVTVDNFAPAFFLWPNNQVVATFQDFTYAAASGTFSGVTTTPAEPGDTIILWGTAFGATNPAFPQGMVTPSTGGPYNTDSVSVTINSLPATVFGAALAPGFAGLYQVGFRFRARSATAIGRKRRRLAEYRLQAVRCWRFSSSGLGQEQPLGERRWIAGENHRRPIQEAVGLQGLRRSHDFEHSLAQGFGAILAPTELFVKTVHERAFGGIRDIPQRRDEGFHAGDGGRATHAVHAVTGGRHAVGHAALRKHQHFGAFEIQGLELQRSEQTVLGRSDAAPISLFENDGRKVHRASAWIHAGERAAWVEAAILVSADQSVADDVQQGRPMQFLDALLGGLAFGEQLRMRKERL